MDDVGIRPARHRLTVAEYHRMGEAGVFGAEDRIELIEGDLIDMAPIGQEHAAAVGRLTEQLVTASAGRAIVWVQNPIRLDDGSEPQPDLVLLRRRPDFYATGERPGPADVLLLIEVADTSLRFDREVKLKLYARAGVPEVWILDVQRGVVEAFSRPGGDRFERVVTYRVGETVEVALLDGASVVV